MMSKQENFDGVTITKLEAEIVGISVDPQFQQEIDDALSNARNKVKRVKIGTIQIDF